MNHSDGEYVRYEDSGTILTNSNESFWAMLKRGYTGVYHYMRHRYLHRCVSEYSGRHNILPLDTIDQFRRIVAGTVVRRFRYEDLVA